MTLISKAAADAKDKRGLAAGYRSGLEEKISQGLQEMGIPFGYETERIAYVQPVKNRTYTPDFVITTKSGKTLYIEAKGRFVTANRTSMNMVRDSNPDLDIRFIFSNPNQRISKTSKTTYAMWCERNNWQYTKFDPNQVVPREWLDE